MVSKGSSSVRIDLNSAHLNKLTDIPGIGPEIARRILRSRPFKDLEDLKRVRGIGSALLERIEPFVKMTPVEVLLAMVGDESYQAAESPFEASTGDEVEELTSSYAGEVDSYVRFGKSGKEEISFKIPRGVNESPQEVDGYDPEVITEYSERRRIKKNQLDSNED